MDREIVLLNKYLKASFIILFLLCLPISNVTAGDVFSLSVDKWDRPLEIKDVSSIEPLPALILAWTNEKTINDKAKIEIRYPGGEIGLILAQRLADYLVVLGVPSSHIELSPGSAQVTQIELAIK